MNLVFGIMFFLSTLMLLTVFDGPREFGICCLWRRRRAAESGARGWDGLALASGPAGLGLREAKDLVEGSPSTAKVRSSRAGAELMKKKFDEIGAKVEIK